MTFGGSVRVLGVAVFAAFALVGCAGPAPAPASDKVNAYYEQNKSLRPAQEDTRPVAAFLGDSFTAGNNDTPGEAKNSYMKRAADSLGVVSFNYAQGGTGYVNPGANESVVFGEQVWRAVSVDPDVVIVGGGINDRSYPADKVGAAASALYRELHQKLPKARIVAVGPIAPGGVDEYAAAVPVRDAIKSAAAANNVAFIDPITEDWMPTKVGVTDSTNFHPNAKGQTLLAGKLAAALKALGIPGK